jgi:hypothetical protein|nr:MAG TPA: hypothetical protein [Bacteriophage sp.]DAG65871.1 MAG TPA: hypothetical protein [Bacteriophage sp.]
MSNYDIRAFRSSLAQYINQSPIETEVKLLALKDLTTQLEKEADAAVAREAAELEKAAQLRAAKEKATQKESEVEDNGD